MGKVISFEKPSKKRPRVDILLDDLFDVLVDNGGCRTTVDITKLLRKVRHENKNVSVASVVQALYHLRKHCAEYGWTVPLVKTGRPGAEDSHRFFAVTTEKDGSYVLTSENRDNARNGSVSTVQRVLQQSQNSSAAWTACANNERSVKHRARMEELADDFAYLARKAKRVLVGLKEEAVG